MALIATGILTSSCLSGSSTKQIEFSSVQVEGGSLSFKFDEKDQSKVIISFTKTASTQPTPLPQPTPNPTPVPAPTATPAPTPNPNVDKISIPIGIKPSPSSRIIYVSSSLGKDSCDGLSEGCPKKSPTEGLALLRDGMPDHLLFKAGDTFSGGLGRLRRGGKSKDEPMLIGSYGSGARPTFLLNGADGIFTNGGNIDYLVITGLHLYGNTKDPKHSSFTGKSGNGVQWLSSAKNLWIDDCKFEYAQVNIQSYSGSLQNSVTLTRNIVVDNYSVGSHAQGFYLDGIDGLFVADNIFDHNGWHETVSGAGKTMFNHNVYIQYNNKNVEFVRNISMRASSHGVQIRPGGLVADNFFFEDAIAVLIGYQGKPDQLVSGEVKNNVILRGTDISDSLPRGFGVWGEYTQDVKVEENVIVHVATKTDVNDRALHERSGMTNGVNYVWDWRVSNKDSRKSNLDYAPRDPNRTIETYQASIGETPTREAFFEAMRAQSRASYDLRYSPERLYRYFKEGLMK